jgi:uncharacterized SAM-dependent methyltransferase
MKMLARLINSKKSKTKDGFTYIWYDQPYNLYFEEEQAMAYLEMIETEKFSKSLHGPAEELVKENANELIRGTSKKIEFYDLGPGLPTKSIPLLKEILSQNKSLYYVPIDISKSFLKITEKEVRKYGIVSHGINCFFEELPGIIKPNKTGTTRIFQIGLTFNNYRPNAINKLLKKLTENEGFSLIITEYYKTHKEQSLLLPYKDIYAEKFNFLALKLLGYNKKDFEYHTQFRNQRIEMGFIPKYNLSVEGFSLTPKHKIVTAISYRYTQYSLTNNIQKHFRKFELYRKDDLVMYKLKEGIWRST